MAQNFEKYEMYIFNIGGEQSERYQCYLNQLCIFVLQVGDKGKSGPAAEHNWSDTASEDQPDSPTQSRQADHEYHEISDEEEPLPKVEVRISQKKIP